MEYNALNDKWNQCEVTCMVDKYTIHKLIGQIVTMGTKLSASESIIGFQSETAEILYKKIEIKQFKRDNLMQKFVKKKQL